MGFPAVTSRAGSLAQRHFCRFGLFAPFNATAVSSLFLAALSVSAAISFLILEMYTPYVGLVQISDAPSARLSPESRTVGRAARQRIHRSDNKKLASTKSETIPHDQKTERVSSDEC